MKDPETYSWWVFEKLAVFQWDPPLQFDRENAELSKLDQKC